MTEENKSLREKLQAIEQIVITALASQPHGDEECGEHLLKAMSDISQEVACDSGCNAESAHIAFRNLRYIANAMRGFCAHSEFDAENIKRYAALIHDEIDAALSPARNFDVPCGNHATMREALKEIVDICDGTAKGIKDSSPSEDRMIIYHLAKVALSTPARNCDRFNSGDVSKDADDALHAILDEGVAGYRSIAGWLLSPVTEGGAK